MVNMWMVRAGENAFLIDDFKELNVISIGWEIDDLTGKTPEDIKKLMRKEYPEASNVSLGNNAAQVIKFVDNFKIGDFVVSYNPNVRSYLVGRITSDYYYSDKLSRKYNFTGYRHLRDVEWIGEVKRDDLSQTSLKPLKSG